MQPRVRAFTADDVPALYEICVRTADAGGDARGRYASDLLMGDLFAVPYAALEPRHAHVLDDGTGRAVGYVVGTADTADFVRRYRAEWIPAAAGRCPVPPSPPLTPTHEMLALHHRPERMLEAGVHETFPAHLHIDLLPGWQRSGWGRALTSRFLDGLREAGVPAVHLGMLTANKPARAFYDRLGFTEILRREPIAYLGRTTDPLR